MAARWTRITRADVFVTETFALAGVRRAAAWRARGAGGLNFLRNRGYSTGMAVSDSARPLPPLSGPPIRASISSEAPRSGFAPADVPRFDADTSEGLDPRAL